MSCNIIEKRIISFAVALLLIISVCICLLGSSAEAYTPPVDNIDVGLYYGSGALEGANLENTSGYGSGYEFGYITSSNEFVSIGAYTDDITISMIIDMNMYYNTSTNNYARLGSGTASTVVGCYHIQLSKIYGSFDEAMDAASTFTSVHAYPKYYNGDYYVCVGNYTSSALAREAASGLSINQDYIITSGSSYTIVIVDTGTSDIIMEFDCGSGNTLGVRPRNSSRPVTWFKGTQYYGTFHYQRLNGGNITVSNVLDLEDYVKCSIPYEMVPSWPIEALKAQAVSARTFSITNRGSKHSGFDLCDTACCQMYNGISACTDRTDQAVDETRGQFLTYDGDLCETFYSASNGGATEYCQNVWSATLPYLKAKLDPYETAIADEIPNYRYTYTYTGAELTEMLQDEVPSASNVVSCEVTEFTTVGNAYKVTFVDDAGRSYSFTKSNAKAVMGARSQRFTITNNGSGSSSTTDGNIFVDGDGSYITDGLNGLYAVGGSSDIGQIADSGSVYAITGSGVEAIDTQGDTSSGGSSEVNGPDTVYTVTGTGNGHNLGLSQYGAYAMASEFGMDYIDILTFYYDGSEIVTADY